MKKIGMLVAVEIDAVLQRYGEPARTEKTGRLEFSVYETPEYELTVCHCGAGEILASAGTQLLISRYGADMIINFGVVGGLTEEMSIASSCIVKKVVHYDYDISGIDPVKPGRYSFLPDTGIPLEPSFIEKALMEVPDLPAAVCASGDKFVADPEKKRALAAEFGADICDMESAAVALICYTNQIPCLMIKTVSDGIDSADRFYEELDRTSGLALDLADRIIRTLNV